MASGLVSLLTLLELF